MGQSPTLVVLCAVAGLIGGPGASLGSADAQVTAWNDQNQHRKGQSVSPVYEGWYRGSDGLLRVVFGYQNRNLEERLDIPIGANNRVEPGPADQGQPTHFLTGRQSGVFVVTLPKERAATEIVWTITSHGNTFSIPANLDPLYVIEALGTLFTKNEPPKLSFVSGGIPVLGPEGSTTSVSTTPLKPLTIDVWVSDDTPVPVPRQPASNSTREPGSNQRPGLTVTWTKFRGAGTVKFSDATPAIENNKATTVVSFEEPGDYSLRVLASDGSRGQCCWTNGYVKVKVAAER